MSSALRSRYVRPPVLPLLAFVLVSAGCAATRPAAVLYDAAADVTTYRSQKVVIGRVDMSSGLASGQRVSVQALAACDGEGCRPDEVALLFLNDSGRDLNLDYRRVEVQFAGRLLEFEDAVRFDEPAQYAVPRGEFLRVPIALDAFRVFVDADPVIFRFGQTGGTEFETSADRISALRDFVQIIYDAASIR